jgi:O6-methylguanine-DNA--protein-cysteine methyltransferase
MSLSDRDLEQALVAAAYRAAAEKCMFHEDDDAMDRQVKKMCAESIRKLTPSDAETKLRELMMQVAEKVSNIPRGKTYSIEDIVDEVLNGHQ